MTEWNLSDKFKEHGRGPFTGRYVELEQVREFIKRLKVKIENAQKDYANLEELTKEEAIRIIEKLAGEKLV